MLMQSSEARAMARAMARETGRERERRQTWMASARAMQMERARAIL